MTTKIHHRDCIVCGTRFAVTGMSARRRAMCSTECQKRRQREHEAAYKASTYDPWMWQNTILDWDE